jgi:serine/threonine protein phosphatase PrpC
VLQTIRDWLGKNKKKKATYQDVQTAPLDEDQLSTVSISPVVHNPPQIIVGSAQSNGLQRDQNEDSIYYFNSLISDENSQLPFGLFIIADGMGGHVHGEIASSSAVRAMASFITRRMLPYLIGLESEPQSDSLQEIMENGFRESQQAVLRKAPGGGTTLTAALILGDQVTLAHVGDSRAYFLYPDGRIQAMTLDHSLVRRYVELGRLTEEQARTDPQKNVLYRALGQLEPFKPDIVSHMMPHPGYLMLCSDGLWGVVPDMEIFKIIASANTPSDACQKLIEAANAAGGPDNISVIVVQYLN